MNLNLQSQLLKLFFTKISFLELSILFFKTDIGTSFILLNSASFCNGVNVFFGIFLSLFLTFFFLEFTINWILDVLNQKEIIANPKVPDFFTDTIDKKEYDKSREYTLTNIRFGKWERMFSALFTLVLLFSGFLPFLNQTLTTLELSSTITGILFFFIVFGILGALNYPVNLYHTFKIEAKYGFNNSTLGLYLFDSPIFLCNE